MHCTHRELQSHKDWLVTSQDIDQGAVRYREVVADHPMIVFQAKIGSGWDRDTQLVGHQLTRVNAWGAGDKQPWGANHAKQ